MKNRSVFPWLPPVSGIFFLALWCTLLFNHTRFLLFDADTLLHIKAGEVILQFRGLPKANLFSFVSPLPWSSHEWLSQLLTGTIHTWAGLRGIMIFFSFLIAFTYAWLFHRISQKTHLLPSLVIISLVLPVSIIHWLARPHIFTLFFCLLFYDFLDKYQKDLRHKRLLYLLPIVTLLWVNLHAGYLLGVMFLGLYLLSNLFASVSGQRLDTASESWIRAKFLAMILIACLTASLFNPAGTWMFLFPFQFTSDKLFTENIVEVLSTDFRRFPAFEIFLFAMMGVLLYSKTRLALIEILLLLPLLHLSLQFRRQMPLFALIAAPVLAKYANRCIEKTDKRLRFFFHAFQNVPTQLTFKNLAVSFLIAAVIGALFVLKDKRPLLREDRHPVKAVEFLKKESLSGNLFNDDEFGDFLVYAAWPKYKVFIDGRSDVYGMQGAEVCRDYVKVQGLNPEWEDILKKYEINWIMIRTDSALSVLLKTSKRWHLIYTDKIADIFVKDLSANRPLIEKYASRLMTKAGTET